MPSYCVHHVSEHLFMMSPVHTEGEGKGEGAHQCLIWSRVLSPHPPDVLVGADLRVRQEEGNHAGLPLQRNCPGPMRRHPRLHKAQETLAPPRERVRVRGIRVAEMMGMSNIV